MNNGTLKALVAKLSGVGLGPKSIHNIVQVLEAVVASCVNEDDEETYPRKWNFEFADMPVRRRGRQKHRHRQVRENAQGRSISGTSCRANSPRI